MKVFIYSISLLILLSSCGDISDGNTPSKNIPITKTIPTNKTENKTENDDLALRKKIEPFFVSDVRDKINKLDILAKKELVKNILKADEKLQTEARQKILKLLYTDEREDLIKIGTDDIVNKTSKIRAYIALGAELDKPIIKEIIQNNEFTNSDLKSLWLQTPHIRKAYVTKNVSRSYYGVVRGIASYIGLNDSKLRDFDLKNSLETSDIKILFNRPIDDDSNFIVEDLFESLGEKNINKIAQEEGDRLLLSDLSKPSEYFQKRLAFISLYSSFDPTGIVNQNQANIWLDSVMNYAGKGRYTVQPPQNNFKFNLDKLAHVGKIDFIDKWLANKTLVQNDINKERIKMAYIFYRKNTKDLIDKVGPDMHHKDSPHLKDYHNRLTAENPKDQQLVDELLRVSKLLGK